MTWTAKALGAWFGTVRCRVGRAPVVAFIYAGG